MSASAACPKIGVGAVIWRGAACLLVKRRTPPRLEEWSLPGGRQEAGETLLDALRREVREETSLEIAVLGLIDVVDALFHDLDGTLTHHYTLIDFSARWIGGEPRAGSDAGAWVWARLEELPRYQLWSETVRIIEMSARLHGPLARR